MTSKASEHTRFQHLLNLLNSLEAKGVMYHLFGSTSAWCSPADIDDELDDNSEPLDNGQILPSRALRGTKSMCNTLDSGGAYFGVRAFFLLIHALLCGRAHFHQGMNTSRPPLFPRVEWGVLCASGKVGARTNACGKPPLSSERCRSSMSI